MRISPFVVRIGPGTVYDVRVGRSLPLADKMIAAIKAIQRLGSRFTVRDGRATIVAAPGLERENKLFDSLVSEGFVIPDSSDLFERSFPRAAHIEICSHCNARCVFCPVSADPLPKKFMRNDVYEIVVHKLAKYPLQWVALNHYNEPTLDPSFIQRVRVLAEYDLKLRLFTNAVHLEPRIARELAGLGIVESIIVNVPSIDPSEYRRLMGVRMSNRLRDNLMAAADCELPLVFCVNGAPTKTPNNLERLLEVFGGSVRSNVSGFANITHDRAELLKNEEVINIRHLKGRPKGCRRMLEQVAVNVDGQVYLCCQDYRQEHILGDLVTQELEEILSSPTATEYRRRVFGEVSSQPNSICHKCVERWTLPEDQLVPISGWLVAENHVTAARRKSTDTRRNLFGRLTGLRT